MGVRKYYARMLVLLAAAVCWMMTASTITTLRTTTTEAFTCRPPSSARPFHVDNHHFQSSSQRLYSALSPEEMASLLDEAVLLYSAVDYTPQSSDTNVSDDIQELRRSEITSLIEDIVMTASSSVSSISPTPLVEDNSNNEEVLSSKERSFDDVSLLELSKELDQAILEGYQSTFTEDELNAWTQRIQDIQVVFEAKLQRQSSSSLSLLLPSSSAATTEEQKDQQTTTMMAVSVAEDTTYADLENRLRELQTVIPMPSSWYRTSVTAAAATPILPDTNNKVVSNTRAAPPPSETTTNEETVAAVVEVSGEQEPEQVIRSTVNGEEEDNVFVDSSSEIVRSVEVKQDSSTPVPNDSGDLKTNNIAPSTERISAESSTSSNRRSSLEALPPDSSEVDEEIPTAEVSSKEVADHVHNGDQESFDAVSAVISAAAIGAVAVTHIPYFAVGVALGPMVKKSIAYAKKSFQSRQKQASASSAKNSPISEGGPPSIPSEGMTSD